jgi:hypothetical protein
MESQMAHKQITTVRLQRRPHRDAKQRLHLAYTYLIEESRKKTLQQTEEKEKAQQAQEVES